MIRPSFFIAAGLTASVWGIVLALWVAPSAAPAATQAYVPQNSREQFAVDLLARLGNNTPTLDTIAFVVAWTLAEDGGDGALARNNPLNTTQSSGAVTQTINSDGVRGYATYEDGLDATVATITNGLYDPVVYALQTNDASGALQALVASPWAGSHYNDGAGWPRVELSIDSAPTGTASDSQSYVLGGDVGVNVRAALNANGGALRRFTIPPGATWSFGHTIAPISAMGYLPVVCGPAGCNAGGGWCDLAAMYMRVADQLGLETRYPQHDGMARPFPGILLDESGNGGDLTITNTTARSITFVAIEDGGTLTVAAG